MIRYFKDKKIKQIFRQFPDINPTEKRWLLRDVKARKEYLKKDLLFNVKVKYNPFDVDSLQDRLDLIEKAEMILKHDWYRNNLINQMTIRNLYCNTLGESYSVPVFDDNGTSEDSLLQVQQREMLKKAATHNEHLTFALVKNGSKNFIYSVASADIFKSNIYTVEFLPEPLNDIGFIWRDEGYLNFILVTSLSGETQVFERNYRTRPFEEDVVKYVESVYPQKKITGSALFFEYSDGRITSFTHEAYRRICDSQVQIIIF
ncbi:hypothetical protein [Paenibacillus tepidiphilus]|uniref:hypothetical protein n=1 Tax=Paenibacillus tepidiphilus TaxID=2608683 RepID=UPI001238E9AD|nr:hypothetical protein [Paenibacillus tepidiphilus]